MAKKTKVKNEFGFESKDKAAKLGYLAVAIERIKDGKLLTLNPDFETYSFVGKYSSSKYSYDRLMDDDRCKGKFRVLSWVKNLNLDKYNKFDNKEGDIIN